MEDGNLKPQSSPKKLFKSVFYQAGILELGNNKSSVFNFTMEIPVCMEINLLAKTFVWPQQGDPLVIFRWSEVAPIFVQLLFHCTENYTSYLSKKDSELQPVFVTQADEIQDNHIKNWTINQIDKKIKKLISEIQLKLYILN